jgi:hypothetical protein
MNIKIISKTQVRVDKTAHLQCATAHRFQEELPVDFLTVYIIDAFCQDAWML